MQADLHNSTHVAQSRTWAGLRIIRVLNAAHVFGARTWAVIYTSWMHGNAHRRGDAARVVLRSS